MKPRGRWRNVCSAAFRSILCGTLMLAPMGCRSVYRLQCTSEPAPAGVLVGQQFLGETECTVEIPKDSEWIEDGRVELTFALPNGTERKHIVDLRGRTPSNPVAEAVSLPFMLGGVGLLWAGHEDDDGDDSRDDDDAKLTLLGAGALGVGIGFYLLLGGDLDSAEPLPVHVDFNAPAAEQ